MSVDPLADEFPEWTPYNYTLNNPVNYLDPDGRSTITDSSGNVTHVNTGDNDTGVYKTYDAQGQVVVNGMTITYTYTKMEKVGETEYIDEFVSPETGEIMTNYRIQFGKSFDPIISRMNKLAQGMDLKEIATESSPGGKFDIKVPYRNVGALLNGKYATSRSAGNYLAGYNAQGGTYLGVGISFETFQKIAGALHVKGSLTNTEKAGIVLFGNSYGPPPAYGEIMYQYRMSRAGWNRAKLNGR